MGAEVGGAPLDCPPKSPGQSRLSRKVGPGVGIADLLLTRFRRSSYYHPQGWFGLPGFQVRFAARFGSFGFQIWLARFPGSVRPPFRCGLPYRRVQFALPPGSVCPASSFLGTEFLVRFALVLSLVCTDFCWAGLPPGSVCPDVEFGSAAFQLPLA